MGRLEVDKRPAARGWSALLLDAVVVASGWPAGLSGALVGIGQLADAPKLIAPLTVVVAPLLTVPRLAWLVCTRL